MFAEIALVIRVSNVGGPRRVERRSRVEGASDAWDGPDGETATLIANNGPDPRKAY